MIRRLLFAASLLSLASAGCIGFPVGKDFTRTLANGNVVDLGPDRLTGKHGIIRPGMTREEVANVASTLQLPSKRIDSSRVGFWVSGWETDWFLISPEGGGTRKYLAAYEAVVRFDVNDRVVECHAEDRPPQTWDRREAWVDPPSAPASDPTILSPGKEKE